MKTLNSNKLISIKDLTIKHKRRTLIEKINLDINSGDVIILTGENGSGKTTLINYFAGIKLSKHVSMFSDLKIAFTPQTIFFKDEVGKIIEKYATMLNNYEVIEKVKTSFSLEDLWESQYEKISSGEQQRVKLAISFLRKPNLIIFDEFTRGLDEPTISEFINLVKNLIKKFKIAIIMITHNKQVHKAFKAKHYHISNKKLKELKNV